jgi:hypothetical protein
MFCFLILEDTAPFLPAGGTVEMFYIKIVVFFDVAPCSLVDTDHGDCPNDSGSKLLLYVGQYLSNYTGLRPKRHIFLLITENLVSHLFCITLNTQ